MAQTQKWIFVVPLLFAATAVLAAGEDESKKTADAWIKQATKAYQVPAGFEDNVEFKIEFGEEEPHTGTTKVLLGRPGEARIEMTEAPQLVVVAGYAYITLPHGEKKAVKFAVSKDDPLEDLREGFEEFFPIVPQLALRWGEGDADLSALTWGMLESPKIERVEELKDATPPLRRLHLSGGIMFAPDEKATAVVDFDAKSSFVVATTISADTEHGSITFAYQHKPKALEAAPKITFDGAGYEFVDGFEDLFDMGEMGGDMDMGEYAPKVVAGEAAPAFSLVDQAGKTHSLKDLEGKFVLLDWWGIW